MAEIEEDWMSYDEAERHALDAERFIEDHIVIIPVAWPFRRDGDRHEPAVEEEAENVPCVKCGRTDLPLHVNYQCPECYTPKEEP